MPSALFDFATVNDAAASTTKKLAKQSILAGYLRTLDPDDLRLAMRYAAGRPFGWTDERTLNVGGATFSDVVVKALDLDPGHWHATVVRNGEIGEALAAVWPPTGIAYDSEAPRPKRLAKDEAPLSLHHLSACFDELAATGNGQRKREILRELLARVGRPREAAYFAKIVFGDLRTGVQDGVLAAAVAETFAAPLKDVQRAALLVGDLDEVALLAHRGALAEARFKLFHPIQFMLATPKETADDIAATFDGRAFFAEDKLDGIRAQVHKAGDRVAIYTRTMDRTDASFPDVVDAIRAVPHDFLLDGEIVPYADGQVQPFANIQKRLGRKKLSAQILRDHPARLVAFDVLYRDGELLMDQPLSERRAALEVMLGVNPGAPTPRPSDPDVSTVQDAPVVETNPPQPASTGMQGEGPEGTILLTTLARVSDANEVDQAFCRARDCRNEGLVLKDPQSPYAPGRRGQAWLKLKTHLPTLDCVVTAAEYGHGKRRDSLSDYTFAVWDRAPNDEGAGLLNLGKAFSGVTDAEIARFTELFLSIQTGRHGRVFTVPPHVVLEIAFDQIQKSARHASGYALRFPRIKRVRWDKRPEDADRLSRVAEVYESVPNFARGNARNAKPVRPPEPTLFDGL